MAPAPTSLRRLESALGPDLLGLLGRASTDAAGCFCTAYLAPGDLGPEAREAIRARRLDSGPADGYLLYREGRAVAWCQCGPWSEFGYLARKEPPVPGAWVVTCMVVDPDLRGQGLAHALLAEVLPELARRGAPYVLACAHRLGPTYSSPLPELPESVCRAAGMTLVRDHAECPLYGVPVGPTPSRA